MHHDEQLDLARKLAEEIPVKAGRNLPDVRAFVVVLALDAMGGKSPDVATLVTRLGLPVATVVGYVDCAVRAGLVERGTAIDGRRSPLTLTPKGRRLRLRRRGQAGDDYGVDLTRPTGELLAELGVSRQRLSQMRAAAGVRVPRQDYSHPRGRGPIGEARGEAGLTIPAAAALLGMSSGTYTRLERGTRRLHYDDVRVLQDLEQGAIKAELPRRLAWVRAVLQYAGDAA